MLTHRIHNESQTFSTGLGVSLLCNRAYQACTVSHIKPFPEQHLTWIKTVSLIPLMDLITLITLQEKNSELPVHVYLYVATLELDKMGLIHPGCSTAFLVSIITIM